ncbi:uncharacterized protein LOC143588782 [Bidens hawaiensis]|uniref:uncharacterized protein LOC143588782 n=1 Tax=Bidens hawaiensis TaxID=980011 RepID=UPI004048F0F9
MFKSTRWRSDKNKIKALFKFQFHATQLAPNVGDALTIAVIPGDTGKPTARLEKTKVKDGSCYWEKPHSETVKFTRDQKTGKVNEKIYRFVVATGSSVYGIVGEVSLDLSCYAEATKSSSVSLPLKNAKFTSLLHVSVQRVQNQNMNIVVETCKEVVVSENVNVNDDNKNLKAQISDGDIKGSIQSNNSKRDHRTSIGSDITLSSSDSSSGLDTLQESESKNTKLAYETSTTTINEEEHQRSSSQWDWLDGSVHDLSTDDLSIISPSETLAKDVSEDGHPDDVIKKLKGELVILSRQAEVSEMELQTLRKQIAKESKRGLDLSTEVAALKEERNELKEECEKMKVKVKVNGNLLTERGDPWALVDELKQELNHEKELNSNLRVQLQKTQESNAELILAVRDLDEMLESKSKSKSKHSIASTMQEVESKPETDDDEDQKALEEIVREHSGMKDAYLQEQKIIDLYNEIELYKRDKDELEMQMEQIALDYEILKQENHDMSYKLEQSQIQEQLKMQYECSSSYANVNELESHIENLNNELKLKSEELSVSVLVIKELETHIKNLEEDLDNQAHGFEADMEDLIRVKVEQEQRAIHAEETLRKVKLQHASTAGKLQDEFRKLSSEMALAFQGSENAAMKAIDEAKQLRVEKRNLEEVVKKVKEGFDFLVDQFEDKSVDLFNKITLKSKHLEEMEKQVKNLSHELKHQKASYNIKIQNLYDERMHLEHEINAVKMELENSKKDLRNVINDKDNEIERLKSRCNDMKRFFKENEFEKENLKKQVSKLKGDLEKKDEAICSIEANITKDRVKLLEGQIKLKETALESSEASFLEKEKDLMYKIEELERQLEVLDHNIKDTQASTAQNSNPYTY